MKVLFFLGFFLQFSGAVAQAESGSPKAGSRMQLALPPIWDEDTKTVQAQEFITVQEAGTIENCTFRGGSVTVKRVQDGQIFFDPDSKTKTGRCGHLVASLEKFRDWDPAAVSRITAEWGKKQAAFNVQLKEEVKGIIEKGADPCSRQDNELKTGSAYKVTGRVFLYGPGTAATSLGGKACQVELNSFLDILGFNRASDFAVAVYRRPEGSSGFVPAGSSHSKTETCKDSEQVVFSLNKLKRHFKFAAPSAAENLQVKGIAAVFSAKAKICANDFNDKSMSSSRARKGGLPSGMGNDTEGAEHPENGVDPAQ